MKLTSMDWTSGKVRTPDCVVLCIHCSYGYDCEGELWDLYEQQPFRFGSLMEAVREMERIMDETGYPQRALLPRGWCVCDRTGNGVKPGKRVNAMENLENKSGQKGTFIVKVLHRQNATWQGQVTWAEQNKKVYFRSALELVRLIDEAMNEQEDRSGLLPSSGSAAGEDEA